MKVCFIYGMLKEVAVETDYVPIVGDQVSLMGCVGVPNEVQMKSLYVKDRIYSPLNDRLLISLREL